MKKTLAAVAVLGAFAGSALAAEVQLYGIVDLGVGYSHTDADGLLTDSNDQALSEQTKDSFQMKSGQGSGSRWGIKGTEDLGNGLKVGFILEDGFDADDGTEDSTDVMFNRESSLFIEGGFGKLALGRMGSINAGQSSWATVGMLSAFGTSDWGGYSAQLGNIISLAGQWDNMIAYQTPGFAGFKVYAQYGMGNKIKRGDNFVGEENESSSDRYYAIGATYNNGPFAAYLAVDSINYATFGAGADDGDGTARGNDIDDSLTVTLGGSYDFEVVKVYLAGQYFDEVRASSLGGITKDFAEWDDVTDKVKGYALTLSADAPLWGGKGMFGIGYVDAETSDSYETMYPGENVDFKRYVVTVGYDYPFSKRTDLYAMASYMQDELDIQDMNDDYKPSAYTFYVGLRHKF